MALDAKSLSKLRARLPRGFRKTAVARLSLPPNDRNVTPNYVSNQLRLGKDLRVIEVLNDIADEHEARLTELRHRARGRSSKKARNTR